MRPEDADLMAKSLPCDVRCERIEFNVLMEFGDSGASEFSFDCSRIAGS